MTVRRRTVAIWLAAMIVPSGVFGQSKPNCDNPQTQVDMNICAGQDYKAADAELNDVYRTAIAAMKQADAGLPSDLKGAEKALREAQRAWLPYRDKTCRAYGFMARGGSMESMLVGRCLAELTRRRTQELKDMATGLGN